MSGPEALVPLVVSVSMFATVFGVVYLRNRENMALIERGINPRQIGQRPRFYQNLKYGLLVLGSGLGLLTAFFIDEFYLNHKALTPSGETYSRDFPQIYFALIAIGGGLGLIISYIVERKGWKSQKTLGD
jgi:hypothetical protein